MFSSTTSIIPITHDSISKFNDNNYHQIEYVYIKSYHFHGIVLCLFKTQFI